MAGQPGGAGAPPERDQNAAARQYSPRLQLRRWAIEQFAAESESAISFPQVTEDLLDRISDDPRFVRELLRTELRHVIYEQVRMAAQDTRDLRGWILVGDTLQSPEALAARSRRKTAFERWFSWLETVSPTRTLRLANMTRTDLLEAAARRRRRAQTEMRIADLWEQLAQGMNHTQTVEERYSPETVEEIAQTVLKPKPDEDEP